MVTQGGRSDLGYLIWANHLFTSKAITNLKVLKKTFSFHTYATCSELPSNISTMSASTMDAYKNNNVKNFVAIAAGWGLDGWMDWIGLDGWGLVKSIKTHKKLLIQL